ncbi:hypothetical protein YC2023_021703 [Brassica napus]
MKPNLTFKNAFRVEKSNLTSRNNGLVRRLLSHRSNGGKINGSYWFRLTGGINGSELISNSKSSILRIKKQGSNNTLPHATQVATSNKQTSSGKLIIKREFGVKHKSVNVGFELCKEQNCHLFGHAK